MTKTIVIASVCCVASFLLGSAAHVNGNADEQQAATAPPQRPFIGRYQMLMPGNNENSIRIFDTATGKYVRQQQIHAQCPMEWVEIDPIGNKITLERFEEKEKEELEAIRRRNLEKQNAQ